MAPQEGLSSISFHKRTPVGVRGPPVPMGERGDSESESWEVTAGRNPESCAVHLSPFTGGKVGSEDEWNVQPIPGLLTHPASLHPCNQHTCIERFPYVPSQRSWYSCTCISHYSLSPTSQMVLDPVAPSLLAALRLLHAVPSTSLTTT